MYLFAAWNEVWVGTAGVARGIELQSFMAAKLKGNFFILLRVAFNISTTSHLIDVKKQRKFCWYLSFRGEKYFQEVVWAHLDTCLFFHRLMK